MGNFVQHNQPDIVAASVYIVNTVLNLCQLRLLRKELFRIPDRDAVELKLIFRVKIIEEVSAVMKVIRILGKSYAGGKAMFQATLLLCFCLFRRVRNCSVFLLQNASSCSRDMPEVNEATRSAPFRFH